MVTPAISASRTSSPRVIFSNAVSTHVFAPPFLNRLPFDDEITTGLMPPGVIMAGPWSNAARGVAAAARPAAVLVTTNSRRLIFRGMKSPAQVYASFQLPATSYQLRADQLPAASFQLQAASRQPPVY